MADPNLNTAQPNQAQTPLTLTGGNDATNRYMNYYNQIVTQLGQNQSPTLVSAPTIEMPREMQAQQITAPERIQAERIATEDRTYGDYANEVASYLNPYLQNAIRSRRDQTADYRAAADADAWSRGMGGSTYLSDQKNQLAKAEARDIMAAQNEFLMNVGQQAFNALQNQYNRNLQANMQNAANALNADSLYANLVNSVNQFNANALMQTDQYNIDNLIDIAKLNAQYVQNTDMFNAEAMNNWQQYLQQLAWGWANQMYAANPIASGGGYGGNSGGGVTTIPQNVTDAANKTLDTAKNVFTSIGDYLGTSLFTNPIGTLTGNGAQSANAASTPSNTTNNQSRGGTYRDYYSDVMRPSTR